MAKENKVEVESRKGIGSAAARRLRKEGKLPGIIYNKGAATPVQLKHHEFEMLLRHQRSENIIFSMVVDSAQPRTVLLKEVQHDPMSGSIRHADFIEISMTEKMRVRVPVVLHGEPAGVLTEDGILEQMLRVVEVECLPTDLVDVIDADVAHLKLGESIRAKDLKLPSTISLITPAETALAMVSVPRKEEEEVKPEEAVEGGAEPEVIAKGKEEGEEGEAAEGAAKPGDKAAGKPGEKGAAKPGEKAAGKPGEKAAAKPGDKGAAPKKEGGKEAKK